MAAGGAVEGAVASPFAIEVITLTPGVWPALVGPEAGLVGRAFVAGRCRLEVSHLRDFGEGAHRQVDDAPYGGGPGMVLMAPPLKAAMERARARTPGPVVLLCPRGGQADSSIVGKLAGGPGMTLVCGRFEGFDERVRAQADLTLRVGDAVLSGGDPAAWCLIDAVVRRLPGVLGNAASLIEESFEGGRLEYPQYTRPVVFEGEAVPEVLRSGDHGKIAAWRRAQSERLR